MCAKIYQTHAHLQTIFRIRPAMYKIHTTVYIVYYIFIPIELISRYLVKLMHYALCFIFYISTSTFYKNENYKY